MWAFWSSPFGRKVRRTTEVEIQSLGIAEMEKDGSTGIYRTDEQVRNLFGFPAAIRADGRREFVKNEIGSYNAAERAVLKWIQTLGQASESTLRQRLESQGLQLTPSVLAKLEPVTQRDFQGEFSVKSELRSIVDELLNGV